MQHTFSRHQLLNITSGRLYTSMDDIYNFFNKVIADGIMTHTLPRARASIVPILKEVLPWNEENLGVDNYDPSSDNKDITFEFTEENKKQFWTNYSNIPSSLMGKDVTVVQL